MSPQLCFWLLIAHASALLASAGHSQRPYPLIEVAKDGNKLTARVEGSPCAHLYYDNNVSVSGWAFLTAEAVPQCGLKNASYAMGYLEGMASQRLVWDAFLNFNASNSYLEAGFLPRVLDEFIDNQLAYINKQAALAPHDIFWQHTEAMALQSAGLQDGYAHVAPPAQTLEARQIRILTFAGDLEDLATALLSHVQEQERAKSAHERMMDCSGLVKMTSSDIFTGHTTFNAYWCMLRIFKHYTLPFDDVMSQTVSFSSRPADLHSKDDFFTCSGGLSVIETSLTVFNHSLYDSLTPNSVPTWIRSQVANRLARNSSDWVDIFLRENSGTHNNEWIVTNYNTFAPGQDLPPNTVWIVDQMVHVTHSEDISALVNKQQFIASFNIPFFADISAVSGYDSHGFNYTTDPRSEIFQRDHSKVVDLTSMKALMNSNDYKHDPLARGSPCNQISARCDLPALDNSSNPYAFGGIDCKVVGMQDVREQRVHVAGGQTHDTVPVFAWREWEGVAHHGMPPVNNFSFVQTSPQTAATRAFYRGADMSYVAVEDCHLACNPYREYAHTDTEDAFAILARHNFNMARLRLWNDPVAEQYSNGTDIPFTPYCNISGVVQLAQRAIAAGLDVLIDFHYSDNWADPGHQIKPKAWENYSHKELTTAVYNYTRSSIETLCSVGAVPAAVQVGNEINSGMLWAPSGSPCSSGGYLGKGCPNNFPIFADLVRAGAQAVRDAEALCRSHIEIVVHTSLGNALPENGKNEIISFYTGLVEQNVTYDIIGLSNYPIWGAGWTGNLSKLQDVAKQLPTKGIMLAEVGYPEKDVQTKFPPFQYPLTPEGQKEFLQAAHKAMLEIPTGRGVFWWGTEYYHAYNAGPEPPLFGPAGAALPALLEGWE